MKLAEKIQDLRKKNGLSQEQLADQLGISRQAISKWESEQSTPDIDKIVLLSEFFLVSTDYLLKEEKDMTSNIEDDTPKEDYTIAVNVKMSKQAFSYLLLGSLFLLTFLFFLLFIRNLNIYMLIVTFPFLFVSIFMFACFGYEYGMGKILSKIKIASDKIRSDLESGLKKFTQRTKQPLISSESVTSFCPPPQFNLR